MATINMQTMRYINLLDKASQVKTRSCFVYNGTIFFAVPKHLVSKAIGPAAINIKKIQEKLGKKIKVIKESEGPGDLQRFVSDVVTPVRFKNIEIKEGEIVITAGNSQNKASLIGRNKRRLDELKQILQDIYNLDLKIV
tara:strand:+ start:1744 stop:2160 length:417 start_codon:yes stop_codon:yes gene_type:complete